jgi:glycosyltransferase involved in cell wall biosynthesis
VIGISKEHFLEYYPEDEEVVASLGERVSFLGKMSHKDVLLYLKRADFSIFYRAKTRVTMAGFPTKFSESISCGTPVITNLTSDLSAYLKDGINGFIIEENIDRSLKEILSIGTMNLKVLKKNVNKSLFDYHNYIVPFAEWFNIIIYNESN